MKTGIHPAMNISVNRRVLCASPATTRQKILCSMRLSISSNGVGGVSSVHVTSMSRAPPLITNTCTDVPKSLVCVHWSIYKLLEYCRRLSHAYCDCIKRFNANGNHQSLGPAIEKQQTLKLCYSPQGTNWI